MFGFNVNTNYRHFFKLLGGTTLAQLIPFLLTPFFSRLYTPKEFALLGILMASSNILFECYTLKYDKAIVVTDDEEKSVSLVKLSLILSLISTLLFIIIFHLINASFLQEIHEDALWLRILLPVLTLFMSGVYVFNYWFQRKQFISSILSIRFFQIISLSVLTFLFGIIPLYNGLTIAYFISWFLTAVFSFFIFTRTLSVNCKSRIFNILFLFKEYSDFPKYSLISSLVYVMALVFPYYLINYFYGNVNGGYFSMCMQLTAVPFSFISSAYMQVYLNSFSVCIREGKRTEDLVREIIKFPLIVFGLLLIPVTLFSGEIFTFILGSHWEISARMIGIYFIPSFLQMLYTALSVFFIASGMLLMDGIIKGIYAIAMCSLFFWGQYTFEKFFVFYSVLQSVIYFCAVLLIFYLSLRYDKKHLATY